MTPRELQAQAIVIVGVENAHRWQTVLAQKLKVNVTTVNRWANGRKPISPPTEVAIAALAREAKAAQEGDHDEKPLPDPVP